VPEARAVLLRAKAAEQALIDLSGLRRGALELAASQTIFSYWLPKFIARFAEAYPGVSLEVTAGNSTEIARAVALRSAELGFVEGAVDDWRLLRQPIGADRIALYAAPSHPLFRKRRGEAELSELRWVLREPGSGTRAHFEQMIAKRGVPTSELQVALELPSNEAVLSAAADWAWWPPSRNWPPSRSSLAVVSRACPLIWMNDALNF
jgi:DNA-binding transcriptional LysR family regulator